MTWIAGRDIIRAMLSVFTDRRCLEHQAPRGYPERPDRLSSILDLLAARGFSIEDRGESHPANPAIEAAIAAVHDPGYVERFERAVERGDSLLDSADNPLSDGTFTAALAAVGATLRAADHAVSKGPAFAAVRPPGHHAERALAMGFCFFNNVAVAAEHLRRQGLPRVAIFDYDVHHGNGTQHLFESRADVFYASTHQFPFYPGTGAASETGTGAGTGFTLNVPLPAGTGDSGYAAAVEGKILPGLRKFAPDVLLVSAGFDAWQADPLGGMAVTEAGFTAWGVGLRALADEVCGGRLLAVLEGGYDLASLPRLVEAGLTGLAGGSPGAAASRRAEIDSRL